MVSQRLANGGRARGDWHLDLGLEDLGVGSLFPIISVAQCTPPPNYLIFVHLYPLRNTTFLIDHQHSVVFVHTRVVMVALLLMFDPTYSVQVVSILNQVSTFGLARFLFLLLFPFL